MHMGAETTTSWLPSQSVMELSVDDLGIVRNEIFDASPKWYDVGLELKVSVATLDSIRDQFGDPKDCFREALKCWLKSTLKPTWRVLVDALRSRTVGEKQLADNLEAKHCSIPGDKTQGKAVLSRILIAQLYDTCVGPYQVEAMSMHLDD